jgi:hypothetical protein
MVKKATKPTEPPKSKFAISDRVQRDGTPGVYCIDWISEDGRFVNMTMEDADFKWFHFPTQRLTPAKGK